MKKVLIGAEKSNLVVFSPSPALSPFRPLITAVNQIDRITVTRG